MKDTVETSQNPVLFSPSGLRILPSKDQLQLGVATSHIQYGGILGEGKTDWDKFVRNNPQLEINRGSVSPNWHNPEQVKKDIDLLAQKVKPDVLRLSLPWEEINPQRGVFDPQAIKAQKEIVEYANERGISIEATLNHFALPIWVEEQGGWINPKIAEHFSKYAGVMARETPSISRFYTLNEPNHVLAMGYVLGQWPPSEVLASTSRQWRVIVNMVDANRMARKSIKAVNPQAEVAPSGSYTWYDPEDPSSFKDRFEAGFTTGFNNYGFTGFSRLLRAFRGENPLQDDMDFSAVQYYMGGKVKFDPQANKLVLREDETGLVDTYAWGAKPDYSTQFKSDLGWPIRPDHFLRVLMSVQKRGMPIVVSENGIADREDKLRPLFLLTHLLSLHEAIARGATVRAYEYWSLFDNPELLWSDAAKAKFGLASIDPDTKERIWRPSAELYRDIIETRALATPEQIKEFIPDANQRAALEKHLRFLEDSRP